MSLGCFASTGLLHGAIVSNTKNNPIFFSSLLYVLLQSLVRIASSSCEK